MSDQQRKHGGEKNVPVPFSSLGQLMVDGNLIKHLAWLQRVVWSLSLLNILAIIVLIVQTTLGAATLAESVSQQVEGRVILVDKALGVPHNNPQLVRQEVAYPMLGLIHANGMFAIVMFLVNLVGLAGLDKLVHGIASVTTVPESRVEMFSG